jgi:RNA-directed DNA polymerase
MAPNLADLQAASTIGDVAILLGFKPSKLSFVLYSKSAPTKYLTFQISKKSGGTRVIEAPNPALKLAQRRLADLLQDCQEEIKQKYGRHDKGPHPDSVTHGFVRHRSIVTNAYQHRRMRFVFNLDLEDFFPSINFGRIRGFFIRDKNFSLRPKVATILAQIACSGNHLPQGSPCSPVIANLVAHILDVRVVKLAARCGCKYTRYADDLSFSTNKKAFPCEIAARKIGEENKWEIGAELLHTVVSCGFQVNKNKTRMQYRASRQQVTGLVVNAKVNVPSDFRRNVRAMVHRLITTGTFESEKVKTTSAGASATRESGTLASLHGKLGFIDTLDLHNRKVGSNGCGAALSSSELTYRRFLLYKDFYAATTPVLVCEGKTDTIYLTHAIRSLAPNFPRPATVDAAGKVTLNIRMYRYADRSTGRVMGLSGGHGDLQKVLVAYQKELDQFKALGLTSPVIVLVDNDAAADHVLSVVRQITRRKADRSAPFSHVIANMYVVLTPLPQGKTTSEIEDLFDESTRAIKLTGRTFDPSNKYSTSTHYGKSDFAHRVVWPMAKTIDFSGFGPLLERMSLAIVEHARGGAP